MHSERGITLVEVIMVVVITAILITVALRSVVTVTETGRVEETKQEMEQLAFAIVGNPELENNGVRTDFGYVGDIGSLPAGLDSLYTRPGGYVNWNGPYIQRRFTQITNDHTQDAWGAAYAYNGGVEIISTGSGSNIVRKLADTVSHLLYNKVTGIILDRDGAPPGVDNTDSVTLRITVPSGAGGTSYKSMHPNASGYFEFDSIPIGNHDLDVIFVPLNDTLNRFVSVLPNSVLYQEYFLTFSPWSTLPPIDGCFEYIANSGRAYSPGTNDCAGIEFKIVNACGNYVSVASITLYYTSSPTAYFQNVRWNSDAVFNGNPDRLGTGEIAEFQAPQAEEWVEGGDTVTVLVDIFKDTRTAGAGDFIEMNNIDVTVELSDGSTFEFNTGACP